MWTTYHTQTHTLVRVYQVGEDLACCGDRDAALMSEFVETALHAKICEPVLAVLYDAVNRPVHSLSHRIIQTYCCATSHGSK